MDNIKTLNGRELDRMIAIKSEYATQVTHLVLMAVVTFALMYRAYFHYVSILQYGFTGLAVVCCIYKFVHVLNSYLRIRSIYGTSRTVCLVRTFTTDYQCPIVVTRVGTNYNKMRIEMEEIIAMFATWSTK